MATRDRKERLAQVTTTTAQKIPVYKDKVRPQQQQQQVTTNHSQRPSQPSHYVSSNKKNLQQQQQQQQQEEEGEEVLSPGALAEQEELKRQHEREEEAQKAEDNDIDVAGYKKLAKIGEGTYGEVFRGLCKKTNTCVALKRVQLNISQGGVPTTAIREVALLKEIQHHNVIRLIDLIYFDTTIYLVFDYCDVDLRKYMDEVGREGLTLKHIKSFTHQLLRGLHYCHSHRVLHRDLKPQNLLIDHTGKLTIADLGLSRAFGVPMRTYTHQVITLWYRAPEILLGSPHYSTAVDMWSVGCILAEMITLRPLFPGDSQIDELFRIFRLLGTPTEAMWPGVTALPDYNAIFPPWKPVDIKERLAKEKNPLEVNDLTIDLLKSLLVYDPYNRISAQKAEEHPFFYDDLSMLQF
ncbi:kinase-like domain-containing protein [Halteromyces radiatus]|uniref:kinase-like domain-containing protein n=1 Tax=Halteromyces radiatus TaxID=101107 RepID=UPI00221E6EFE|nr:kinase-like domain-containing protein [Halteromyces radiatus]KAI8099509.1 kinase-like domain-containing protein [Halteromyces radiatus]